MKKKYEYPHDYPLDYYDISELGERFLQAARKLTNKEKLKRVIVRIENERRTRRQNEEI